MSHKFDGFVYSMLYPGKSFWMLFPWSTYQRKDQERDVVVDACRRLVVGMARGLFFFRTPSRAVGQIVEIVRGVAVASLIT